MHRFLPMLRYSSPQLSFEFTRLPALETAPEAEQRAQGLGEPFSCFRSEEPAEESAEAPKIDVEAKAGSPKESGRGKAETLKLYRL